MSGPQRRSLTGAAAPHSGHWHAEAPRRSYPQAGHAPREFLRRPHAEKISAAEHQPPAKPTAAANDASTMHPPHWMFLCAVHDESRADRTLTESQVRSGQPLARTTDAEPGPASRSEASAAPAPNIEGAESPLG